MVEKEAPVWHQCDSGQPPFGWFTWLHEIGVSYSLSSGRPEGHGLKNSEEKILVALAALSYSSFLASCIWL